MKTLLALYNSMDDTQRSMLVLVAIVVIAVAGTIWLFCRPTKTTDI